MFDHNIFQENLVGVDYCEKMVAETNPGVLEQANRTEAPHAADHGYRTIGDIMRALNPFAGEFYREALQVSRYTREMFCLMEGRHVHPSTLYPGGVGTVATDPAVHRLPDPAHALRRVHEAGRADARRPVRLLLRGAARLRGGRPPAGAAGLLGRAQRPRALRLRVPEHDRLGPQDVRHPGRRRRRQARHQRPRRDQPRHPDPAGQLVLPGLGGPGDVRRRTTRWATRSTSATPGTSTRSRRRRSATSTTSTAGRCRRAGSTARTTWPSTPAAARSPGCGRPRWPAWSTSAYVEVHRAQRADQPAADGAQARGDASSGSRRSTSRAGRCPTRSSATGPGPTSRRTPRPPRCTSSSRRSPRCAAGNTKTWETFTVPGRGGELRLHRGGPRRALAPHGHPRREDRELPPVPADAVERQRPRQLRHARARTRTRCRTRRSSRRTRRTKFKGIDIMRAVRSFDPCLPCGVHMYLGNGKPLHQKMHSPDPARPALSLRCSAERDLDPARSADRDRGAARRDRRGRRPRGARGGEELVRVAHAVLRRRPGADGRRSCAAAAADAAPPARGRPAGRRPAGAARPAPGRAADAGRGTRWTRRGGGWVATASGIELDRGRRRRHGARDAGRRLRRVVGHGARRRARPPSPRRRRRSPGSSSTAAPAGRRCCRSGCGPRTRSARPASPRPPMTPGRRSRLRRFLAAHRSRRRRRAASGASCAPPGPGRAPAPRRARAAARCCARAAPAACCSRRRRAACRLPARCPTGTCHDPGFALVRRAVGRAAGPGRHGVLPRQLGARRRGRRAATRARRGRPRASSPLEAWADGVGGRPRSPRLLEPDVEALLVRRGDAGRGGRRRGAARAGRRLLPAGRPGAPALEGLRRRRGGVGGDRRVLRRRCGSGAGDVRSSAPRRGSSVRLHRRPGPSRYAAGPVAAAATCAVDRDHRARARRRAAHPDPHRAARAAATPPARRPRLADLFGEPAALGRDAQPAAARDRRHAGARVHRDRRRSTSPCR